MPLTKSRHTNRVATAWLESLLPDNPAVREEWGRRFQVSARSAFSPLRHVGRDAAGGVQVLPLDDDRPDAALGTGEVRRLSEAEVTQMLVALTMRDHGWEVGEGAGRWSLAGAQNKVALHRLDDGTWAVALDSTPLFDVASDAPHLKEGESLRSTMKVGKNWQVREVTAQDWSQVGAALGLDLDEALDRVEHFRQGLPDALAAAPATALAPFLKDAQRVANAARQAHLKAVRVPRASRSQRR